MLTQNQIYTIDVKHQLTYPKKNFVQTKGLWIDSMTKEMAVAEGGAIPENDKGPIDYWLNAHPTIDFDAKSHGSGWLSISPLELEHALTLPAIGRRMVYAVFAQTSVHDQCKFEGYLDFNILYKQHLIEPSIFDNWVMRDGKWGKERGWRVLVSAARSLLTASC